MDIFELAKAKKMFGGGGGKRKGTAIPAGEVVERIYFNTANTREETCALLSQLTYIETELSEAPIYPIYVNINENNKGDFVLAIKYNSTEYGIMYMYGVDVSPAVLFGLTENPTANNGWLYGGVEYRSAIGFINYLDAGVQFVCLNKIGQPVTDFMGLPIGTENEKIKNVLSITPF